MEVLITLLAKRLYLGRRCMSEMELELELELVLVVRVVLVCKTVSTYESVKKPEAATPQIRKFHELRSSSYLS